MRTPLSLVAIGAVLSLAPAAAVAQLPFGGGNDSLRLLRQESVQKELKLSAAQVKKVGELSEKMGEKFREVFAAPEEERGKKIQQLRQENEKAVAGLLDLRQAKRLREIVYQRQGTAALAEPDVARALGLSDDQTRQLRKINQDTAARVRELFQGGPPDDDTRKKIGELQRAASEKRLKLLSDKQKAKWKDLQGKPFTGEVRAGFPGGVPFGGDAPAGAGATPELADAGTVFFNGKDLAGWEGLMKYWSVKDGAIVGYTPQDPRHNTFLCSKKSYKDFELKFKVRLKGGVGNSGVQIRSAVLDRDKFTVRGPQCDIGQQFWGSLVGERMAPLFIKLAPAAVVKKAVKPADFNDYYIKCVGKHVTIKINGQTTVDGDFPSLPEQGIIAFQLHAGFKSMEVTFKDVRLTNLSPAKAPTATPAEALKVARDFKAELLYSVPKDRQGSWVNMTVDPKGRLIVSDQYGGLYRVTPPAVGQAFQPDGKKSQAGKPDLRVEKLDLALGGAHGLLWAFDSLYVVVNEGVKVSGARPRNGLHRARSRDSGDTFEKPELLREVRGRGEHGAHAVVLGPDRKSLFVLCGNDTKLVSPLAGSRVPLLWGEDRLFPIVANFGGVLPPAGCIYKVSPDGKSWEPWSVGYRNPFDLAFNRHGDLFTYDSDMEWDMNTPWYRPTRVCLATSGSEFGFRDGSGNSPPRYVDTLPAVCDVGPGSPTGMTFGYGARFPAKYQEALFLCDWSYGKIYALHLTPDGSAYKGELEEFLNGAPLPVTDAVVNPADGALYFITGGRRTQSGLYRVTYVGKLPTKRSTGDDKGAEARALRHKLEAFHGRQDPKAVETAWPYLSHEDRYVRFAARVAIEHQGPKTWQERALKETNPAAATNALLALVRAVGQDPVSHPRKPGDPVPGAALKAPILQALDRLDMLKLDESQRSDLLRVYVVLFNRLGGPDRAARNRLVRRLDPLFPAKSYELNADLCHMLVYLEAPGVAGKALKLLAAAPTQEEQMEYAKSLRFLQTGWTPAQRKEYFAWYARAVTYKGGLTFRGTLGRMKRDAVALLTAREKEELKPVLEARTAAPAPEVSKPRPFVKAWKLDELVPLVEKGLTRRDFDRGRRLFGEARCFSCHRFDNEGGSQAPDLTVLSGRYSVRDLLEKVLDPDRAISDQYAATVFTLTDGRIITGRIVNYFGENMMVMTNMLDPSALVSVNARKVESRERSKVSMMPKGLLDTLKEDEVLDLVAYLLSRGDRNHKMFRGARAEPARKAEGATGKVIPVWPGVAPGSEGWKHKEVEYRNEWDRKAMVRNVTTPTLTAFLPYPAVATGAAVIICPGGGFRFLSWQSEGTEVARWLQARGVAAFVLKYRLMETPASPEDFRKEMAAFFKGLANRKDRPEDRPRAVPEEMRKISKLAIADARQAIKLVRKDAARWGIKPDRVGIMGFSAGGMVTMGVAMAGDKESRPDFAAPIYGGGTGGARVPKDAPPLFILCASDDRLAAAGSVRLYSEWKVARRPVELHLYEKGGHGFGMTPKGLPVDRWIERYGDWLGQRGLIKSDSKVPQRSPRPGR
jgi:putative heme-binding domain-containing protein